MFKNINTIIAGLFLLLVFNSCKKSWLDAKPDQQLVVPATLKDFQALLDNTQTFNTNMPNLPEIGADDYYVYQTTYLARPESDRNKHIWAPGDVFVGENVNDWTKPYTMIYYANTVLEGVEKVDRTVLNQQAWDNVKGSGSFYRAMGFFYLSQLFCKPYTAASANTDLGIILRTSSDYNIPSVRSSVQQTYDQIISDLKIAKDVLTTAPAYVTRPSKQAALGLLARTYLLMDNYDSAGYYANAYLQIKSSLIDYRTSPTTGIAFSYTNNPEIAYLSTQTTNTMLTTDTRAGYVDSTLYKSYVAGDRRKLVFYDDISATSPLPSPRTVFEGSYWGSLNLFDGIATDEMYLIRGECYARKGNKTAAMEDLNALLAMRWTGTYTNMSAIDANDALIKIVAERRKELCFRGIRWSDLRRLNKEPQFAITIKRVINNTTYTLPPNDNRYVWPIPDNEILISHVQQNPR